VLWTVALSGTLAAAPAAAQSRGVCNVPERSATPIDVPLDDLALSGGYRNKAVRTKGYLEVEPEAAGGKRYVLRDGPERVAMMPCPEIARDLEDVATKRPRLEVVGLASDNPDAEANRNPLVPATRLLVWSYTDVAELERARRGPGGSDLAALLEATEPTLGKTVRVTAQFGGRNLLKDLPPDSAPDDDAWVLRDASKAIWVIGKRPEGQGFKLDPDYARDAGKWLAVEGRLERCGERLCLRARRVTLSGPPS
jgi:hypothetical protein